MFFFNPEKYRKDFPVLQKKIIYMDSSCVSLKPTQVVDEMNKYYNEYPACGGRSNHRLGVQVTNAIEESRKKASNFFNSKKDEIVFTKNTTESINILANSLGLKKGEKVLISNKEHNSNLVPWQVLAKNKGINLEFYEFDNHESFSKKVIGARLASFVNTSNLDGSSQDVKELTRIAHESGAKVMIDGAQSAPHKEINVKKIGAEFYAASGHKMLGPSGTGILYGKREELESLNQFITGGETVKDTTYESHEIEDVPHRFEAGLQNYAGIIGLGAAFDYLNKVGLNNIQKFETKLNKIMTDELKNIKELSILGPEDPEKRSGIVSFNIKGIDPHDIALQLDSQQKIMIRSGYHCCHSWFNANNIKGSARASLYFYNTEDEVRKFVETLKKSISILK